MKQDCYSERLITIESETVRFGYFLYVTDNVRTVKTTMGSVCMGLCLFMTILEMVKDTTV